MFSWKITTTCLIGVSVGADCACTPVGLAITIERDAMAARARRCKGCFNFFIYSLLLIGCCVLKFNRTWDGLDDGRTFLRVAGHPSRALSSKLCLLAAD